MPRNGRDDLMVLVWIMVLIGIMVFLWITYVRADTNPPLVQNWFANLVNHLNGACCGEHDGYPAKIERMPSAPRGNYAPEDGYACVTEPAGKEIIVQGIKLKTKPTIKGNLCVYFSWNQLTQEHQGNPMDVAYVFVRVKMDNTIDYVYCVAALPQVY